MSAPDPKPHRLRKWLYIAGGLSVGVPLLLIIVLYALAQVRAVRPDQLKTPAGLVHFKTVTGPSWADPSSGKLSFDEILSHGMPKDSVDIYRKWSRMLATDKSIGPLLMRRSGEKLTPEQRRWLDAHRDDLQDLIRMAASTGGKPILTCEQAAALNYRNWAQVPVPNYLDYQSLARILNAEAWRRRMEGDVAGAADAILAVHQLSKSISEPNLIGHLIGVAMQSMADLEMKQWIMDGSVPDAVARRFREQASTLILGRDDARGIMELDYELGRREYIDMLNGPITGLFRQDQRLRVPRVGEGTIVNPDDLSLYDLIRQDPRDQTMRLAFDVAGLALMKADAAGVIERYDSAYASIFRMFDQNERLSDIVDHEFVRILPLPISPQFPIANFDEMRTRTMNNVATLNLNLAGLNLIENGNPGREPDPFTNESLKMNPQQDATIIYSLGPDASDQHGLVTYNPTNGTFSPGDIIFRIPRRPRSPTAASH